LLSLVFVALVVLCLPATHAFGQLSVENGCMEDVYQAYGGAGSLQCTANDVRVASVTNITILDDGCLFVGDTITFSADYEIVLTAQARHDIGVYLATDGDPNADGALTGNCTILTLPIPPTDLDGTGDDTKPSDAFGYCSADGGASFSVGPDGLPLPCDADGLPDCGVGDTCEEFGPGIQDTCGDIDDAPNPIMLVGIVITAECQDPDGDGRLDLPNCTSWRQPGSNDLCLSPLAAFPGAPSKCNCDPGLDIGICVPGFCDDGNVCTQNVCFIGEGVCENDDQIPCSTDGDCVSVGGLCEVEGDAFCDFPPEPSTTVCDNTTSGPCDAPDLCDGAGNCVETFQSSTTVCRAGSGDLCDPAELCTGSSVECPADVVAPATTICNSGSGDICDPAESCTGNPDEACPADTVASPTTICRAGSGDICDPDESCTGVADAACPADVVASATTICNAGSGDICDPDESCTGNPGDACPNDTVSPPTTICRAGSGDICDPDESCSGVADDACPPDVVAPPSTPCEADGDLCTDDHCDGEGQCVLENDVICDECEACISETGECVAIEPPDASATNDGPACSGDDVQLSAGPDGQTYSWSGPDGFSSDDQSPVVSPAVPGDYCVNVTDPLDCSQSACTTVVVNLDPTCFIDGPSTVCNGSTCNLFGAGGAGFAFSLKAFGSSPPVLFNWSVNGDAEILGATDKSTVRVNSGIEALNGYTTGSFTLFLTTTSAEGCTSDCSLTVEIEDCEEGDITVCEGCSHGYWRQKQHFPDWTPPYHQSDLFAETGIGEILFEDAFPGQTLGRVVRLGGGGLNALGRETVAALLNAASPDVNYALSVDTVITMFNDVFPGRDLAYSELQNIFEEFNHDGCPLGGS